MERYPKMSKYAGNNLLGVPTIEDPRSLDRLEKAMTGQKDADLLIMSNLDDETLLSFCLANRSANLLCKDENFWRNRFIGKYGKPTFVVSNWRRAYLKTISYLNGENDYDILYHLEKNREYEMINLIIFLDNFRTTENKLRNLHFLLGVKGAIEINDREMINFFMKMRNFSQFDLNQMLNHAVTAANKDLIDFFIASGAKDSRFTLQAAIETKNLDIVKYIMSKNIAPATEIFNEGFQYSREHGTQEISYYFIELLMEREEEIKRKIQRMRKNARARK
jgi:hypothetical protein